MLGLRTNVVTSTVMYVARSSKLRFIFLLIEVLYVFSGARHMDASDRWFGANPRMPRVSGKFPNLLVVGAGNSCDLGPVGFR